MARASDYMEEWYKMLELLNKNQLVGDEEDELHKLQLFFQGKDDKRKKKKHNKSKPIVLIDPNGNSTVYESRKELIHKKGANPNMLYDALLRNNGIIRSGKLKGYRVKEMK